jgi:hypothetical protein
MYEKAIFSGVYRILTKDGVSISMIAMKYVPFEVSAFT